MTILSDFLDASPTIDEVDQRIQSLQEEIRKLRYYRNNHLTIVSRLPMETLANIFTILALSEFSPPQEYLRKILKPHHLWFSITHVCKLWRDIAIANQRMWSIVYTSMRKELTRLFVERSGSLPLYVSTHSGSSIDRHNDATVKYLLANSARIWRLELWHCHPRLVDDLSNLNVPILKEMSLTVDDTRHPMSTVSFQPVVLEVLPLRYLSIRNTLLDLDSPFIHQLRTLKLNYTTSSGPNKSPREILTILGRLKHLKHLELSGVIVGSANDLGDTIVDMPDVHTLELTVNDPVTLGILNHLSLPSMRSLLLSIEVVTNTEALSPVLATFHGMLPQSTSPRAQVDINVKSSKFDSSLSIWLGEEEEEEPPFQITISEHADYSVSLALFTHLPDHIIPVLGLFTKSSRHLSGRDANAALRQFLLSLPSVEELHTHNFQDMVTILSSTPTSQDGDGQGALPTFSLSHLKRIMIEDNSKYMSHIGGSQPLKDLERQLEARKLISAGIETFTVKCHLKGDHNFSVEDGKPFLKYVDRVEVRHFD